MHNGAMAITLTIKQVPEQLAERLRERAAAHHRSLQGELMFILHESLDGAGARVSEPETPTHTAKRSSKAAPTHGRRLTLEELWERSRQLGKRSESESTPIIRQLRDERHRR
jgi:plasmid stability protein